MRLSFVSKLLNISEHEWPRVIVSWVITFFLRVGFIVGWTVIIAMFVGRMGIEKLPILFILNALLVIGGTILFSKIIEKIRREILIIINILVAATFLIAATIFVASSNWIFFGIVLAAESIMLAQLNILISLFIEELFTPLESQRTFPLIESSETLGAIAGGIIVSTLAHSIPSYKFLYIWVLAIMLVIPIILSFKRLNTELPSFEEKKEEKNSFSKIASNFKKAQKSPFLKGLIVVIILQWMFINLLEFQYTKSVQQNVYHETEETLVHDIAPEENMYTSIIDIEQTSENIVEGNFEVAETSNNTSELEEQLTAKLGLLQIIFGIATLIMQLLISSRILKGLGIINSMAIHPLVAVLNLTGLTLRFNMLTASISKGASEMTGLLFQNAYHSSYYAFGDKIIDQMKELLEGIIKPCGAILGMSIIVLLENFLIGSDLTLTINIVLVIIAILSTVLISGLQSKYTDQSQKNIDKGNSTHTRINSIEILGQRGHRTNYDKLIKIIQRKNEDEEVQLKAIETLKEIKDPETIPHLITCLECANPNIRLAVVETLGEFEDLDKRFFKSAFGEYRIGATLKKLFEKEENEEIRSAIIQVLAKLNQKDIVPFLLKKLGSKDEKIVADCIYICGLFHDPNSVYYLEKYLDHKDPKIRANAIIALWQFRGIRQKLNHYLDQLIDSRKKEWNEAAIYVIAELSLKDRKKHLYQFLEKEESPEALFALAKLAEKSAIIKLLDYILKHKKDWKDLKKKLNKLPKKFINTLTQYLHHEVSHLIHRILTANSHLKAEEFSEGTLEELQDLYQIINETKAEEKIKKLIKSKKDD